MLHVVVQSLSGRQIQIGLEQCCCVAKLKHMISEVWNIPTLLQSLVSGTVILDDDADLTNYCAPGDAQLFLTMLVSAEMALRPSACKPEKLCALQGLDCFWEAEGRGAPVSTIMPLLTDRIDEVRIAAVGALARWAPRGDASLLAGVSARLWDGKFGVRLAAVRALGRLAERGDPRAVADLTTRLKDSKAGVRVAAIQALAQLANWDDARPTSALITCLNDGKASVRLAAERALEQLAGADRAGVLPAIAATRLGDRNEGIRSGTMRWMARLNGRRAELAAAGAPARPA
mmetsp:Transcript_97673/g.276322  ORF Transcript_97673/g.276322 Transcript_97673/m.276322 type:complete len:289 (-) Transcript_97673:153-1019(-)